LRLTFVLGPGLGRLSLNYSSVGQLRGHAVETGELGEHAAQQKLPGL